MKKIVLLMLTGLPALAFAQDNKYTLQGTLGAYNAPAKVYLQHAVKGKQVTDSTVLKNGKFEFTGTVGNDPAYANLIFNAKGTGVNYSDYKQIYLEKGTITVTGTDKIGSATASGTKTNDDNERYNTATKPVSDAYDALEAKTKAATPEQQKTEAFQRENGRAEKVIDAQESEVNKQFIKNNPDSYVSMVALEEYAYGADYATITPLFESLSAGVKQTESAKKFADLLPKIKAVALGAHAPEFAEADTSGKIVNLASFKGKYVLIDFWASWCGPCRHENPNVVRAFNKYKNQSFTIVGVSLDKPGAKDKWLAAIHKDGLTWTHVSDLKFWDSKVAVLYGIHGIPQNFLLDPNGNIIAKGLRGFDLEDKLAELFGKAEKGEAGK